MMFYMVFNVNYTLILFGNEAIQEAYAGKTHYNCNVVIVVTNNYFTNQAEQQALDTQVILWDRDILKKKN